MSALRYVSLAVCLFAGTHVYGQFQPNSQELHGKLIGGPDFSYDAYVLEIANMADRSTRIRADVLSDGSFVVRNLTSGDYFVRVLTLYEAEITTTMVSVGPTTVGVPCEIRLPEQKRQKPISGTVSMQQLSHPLSKPVLKALASGQKMYDAQDFSGAAQRFREAVHDDPQSPQAHAELGMAFSRLEDWNDAVAEYRAATVLDPGNSTLHSNLASVLASANRKEEAQSEASAALKLDPSNARAHYVLAAVLIHQPGRMPDVMSHLMAARDAFPAARKAMEKICAAAGPTDGIADKCGESKTLGHE